ncbi:MAG: SusD/RagB family nutrient-binding outer membrane lipoprotein [Bacteroidota bacterium]
MKTYKLSSFFLAILLLWSTSCDDFGDLNVDPNEPSQAPPALLLTGAQTSVATVIGATLPTLYVQHLSETQYTTSSRYSEVNFDFNTWYTGPLANLDEIIRLNTDEATRSAAAASGSNNNQIAVARILKAYFYHFMTDRWGALPLSQALQGKDNFNPTYDMQDNIYSALFQELREATAQIDGGPGVSGDIIFDGNMDRWRAFANTIRMTMAIRISGVSPTLAQSEFESAVADGVITSDVMYQFLQNADNQNPWFGRFITRTDYAVSETMIDYLLNVSDPRIEAFAEPALATGTFVGMPYGIISAGDIENSSVSFITDNQINTQDAPLPIFTTAQVEFYLAEAAMNGWNIPGTAQEHYEVGIQASMQQWGVFDDAAFAAYIAQPDVAWSDANAMELIGEQKWVALYMQGYEAWAEWRRTGFPVLAPAPDALNNSGEIPRRHGYPTSESTLNKANYDAAVAMQGEDGVDTRLWWDMN